jgi:site-specific DNA-cytosine methylase
MLHDDSACDVQSIFDNMVDRFSNGRDLSRLNRKIRVATMCSGTESPLLALTKISYSLSKSGVRLEVDHAFSCEIEPFKQAYIDRNFAPKLLFRDIRELGDDQAATAYGALETVPLDVDLLVAGTSCVDYSPLKTEKKGIEEQGESGQTFRGMMAWVERSKPSLVLLENVCQAPWGEVCKKFEALGYSCCFTRLDTKKFYIPHTRTRVYLLASLAPEKHVVGKWKDCVKELEVPARRNLNDFLFSEDDLMLEVKRNAFNQNKKRSRTHSDWSRCEIRHKRCRVEEKLGESTPLTRWPVDGCRLPDHAWNDWGKSQPERVLDLMDIYYLRFASNGVDANYKSMSWNLTGVPREAMASTA